MSHRFSEMELTESGKLIVPLVNWVKLAGNVKSVDWAFECTVHLHTYVFVSFFTVRSWILIKSRNSKIT